MSGEANVFIVDKSMLDKCPEHHTLPIGKKLSCILVPFELKEKFKHSQIYYVLMPCLYNHKSKIYDKVLYVVGSDPIEDARFGVLIGKSKEHVYDVLSSAGIEYRTVEEDGRLYVITHDFHPDRMNLKFKNGLLVEHNFG